MGLKDTLVNRINNGEDVTGVAGDISSIRSGVEEPTPSYDAEESSYEEEQEESEPTPEPSHEEVPDTDLDEEEFTPSSEEEIENIDFSDISVTNLYSADDVKEETYSEPEEGPTDSTEPASAVSDSSYGDWEETPSEPEEEEEEPEVEPEPEPEPAPKKKTTRKRKTSTTTSTRKKTTTMATNQSELEASLLVKAKETVLDDIRQNHTSEMFTPTLVNDLIDSYLDGRASKVNNADAIFTSLIDEVLESDYKQDYYGELVADILEAVKADVSS